MNIRRIWLAMVMVLMLGGSGLQAAWAGAYEDFFTAIRNDDSRAMVNLLFRGFDPNTVDPDGVPGLVLAAREGSLKVAELLLSQNTTKVELRTSQDENALMLAALGGYESLAKTLIAKGADVNKTGWTPLHYAATKGHIGIIKMLLDNHAYIDAESPNQSTPLMMAAMYGTLEAVKLLVEEGADPLLQNEQMLSTYDFAMRANRDDSAKFLASLVRAPQPKRAW